MDVLCYRAGHEALASIRQRGGVGLTDVSTLVLPAIGPKWLVLAGFDRALIGAGWLDPALVRQRLLLFGASAGAWRALALCARDPAAAHASLLEGYIAQRFTHADTPAAISSAYRQLLAQAFSAEDLAFALRHPRLELALACVRALGPLGQLLARDARRAQALLLGAAGLCNLISARTQAAFFERTLFTSGSLAHPLLTAAPGRVLPLTEDNVLPVALASGTVPLYMQAVQDLPGAPPGVYLDGGFSDYHLNRATPPGGLSILFLHQGRIIPSWLDKLAPLRGLSAAARSNLLLVHPSEAFVRSLPGGAVPTRDDFQTFVHEPERRIERWRTVAAVSGELGQAFLHDARSGALAARVQPL